MIWRDYPGVLNTLKCAISTPSNSLLLQNTNRSPFIMPSTNNHPIKVPPGPPLYRFAATALGASMWFWVCFAHNLYPQLLKEPNWAVGVPLCGGANTATFKLVDVPRKERRPCSPWLEAPLGSLNYGVLSAHFFGPFLLPGYILSKRNPSGVIPLRAAPAHRWVLRV